MVCKYLTISTLLAIGTLQLPAAITLNLTADALESTQITITAGAGTNTTEAGGISSRSSANGFLPDSIWDGNSGLWQTPGLEGSPGTTLTFSTSNFSVNGTSTLQYTKNGGTFGNVINQVEVYQFSTGYQFRLGPSSTMTYPALAEGDTFGFTGFGYF